MNFVELAGLGTPVKVLGVIGKSWWKVRLCLGSVAKPAGVDSGERRIRGTALLNLVPAPKIEVDGGGYVPTRIFENQRNHFAVRAGLVQYVVEVRGFFIELSKLDIQLGQPQHRQQRRKDHVHRIWWPSRHRVKGIQESDQS